MTSIVLKYSIRCSLIGYTTFHTKDKPFTKILVLRPWLEPLLYKQIHVLKLHCLKIFFFNIRNCIQGIGEVMDLLHNVEVLRIETLQCWGAVHAILYTPCRLGTRLSALINAHFPWTNPHLYAWMSCFIMLHRSDEKADSFLLYKLWPIFMKSHASS